MVKKITDSIVALSILCGIAPFCRGMTYEESYEMAYPDKRMVNITDSYGNQAQISYGFILASDNLAGAYAATTGNKIDLRGSKETISKETLSLLYALFQASDKEIFLASLSSEQIKDMYHAERYLGVQSIRYFLAKEFAKHNPSIKIDKTYKADRKFARSSLLTKGVTPEITDGVIDLSNRNLESLQGIENIPADQRALVTAINISNNPISTLSLDKLFNWFANLRIVNAQNCQIKKIKLTKPLPLGTCLFLANNKLANCPLKFLNVEDCFVDLFGNQFSQPALDGISQIKPSFLQRSRHKFLNGAIDSLKLSAHLMFVASLVPSLFLGAKYLEVCDKIAHKLPHPAGGLFFLLTLLSTFPVTAIIMLGPVSIPVCIFSNLEQLPYPYWIHSSTGTRANPYHSPFFRIKNNLDLKNSK